MHNKYDIAIWLSTVDGENPNGEKPNGENLNGEKPNGENLDGQKLNRRKFQ